MSLRKLCISLVFVAFNLNLINSSSVRCNNRKDEGKFECVKAPGFNEKYQWAICLSEKEIKAVSSSAHTCSFWQWRCMYLWMQEYKGQTEGDIQEGDVCTPGQIPPQIENRPALPQHCTRPIGDSCDWYTDCLEARYNCGAEGYPIAYAKKYCERYNANYNKFSPEGKKWVDKTRLCLQNSLVKTLRPYADFTCDDVRQIAFDSHTPCYLDPEPGSDITICSVILNPVDACLIARTIGNAFFDDVTREDTIDGAGDVITSCFKSHGMEYTIKTVGGIFLPFKNLKRLLTVWTIYKCFNK